MRSIVWRWGLGSLCGVLVVSCGGGDGDEGGGASKTAASNAGSDANAAAPVPGAPEISGSNWKGVYTIIPYESAFGGSSGGSSGGGSSSGGSPGLPGVPDLPKLGVVAAVGDQESVRATIEVNGDSMIVTTSRPAGSTAHRLTGTLRSDGTFRLTDAADGEIWSSYEGPASSHHIALLDFVKPPSSANPRPNLYKLDLRR